MCIPFQEVVRTYIHILFRSILTNKQHVLQSFLPERQKDLIFLITSEIVRITGTYLLSLPAYAIVT